MADEENISLSNKEANSIMNKVLTEMRRSRAETTKGKQDNLDANMKVVDAIEGLTDAQKKRFERSAVLEQVGIGKEQAKQLVGLKEQLELNEERLSKVKEVLEETGQDVSNNQEVKRLELEKRNLEEMMKFGKTLGTFERGFVKFAGGKFEDLIKEVQEGGKLTVAGIGTSLKEGLASDVDKIMSFFGPVAGVIQQIPFLGTLLTFLGNVTKSGLIRLASFAKQQLFEDKKGNKFTKMFQRKSLRNDEQAKRAQLKKDQGFMSTSNDGESNAEVSNTDVQLGNFLSASVFLATAATIGGAAGAGMTAAAGGMTAFGSAAWAMGKALVIGGGALAIGLTAVFGSFALGEKMGAFDGMQEFGKVNMLKVLGSMLGLATLMGVLGSIVSTGIGALIMGVGALAIMGLIGTLVVIGKGLGSFAESILPFEQLNIPALQTNIRGLAKISGDFAEVAKISASPFDFNQFVGNESQLDILSRFLSNMTRDLDLGIENLEKTKVALQGFKFPKTTFGEAMARMFGVDGVSALEDLMTIDFNTGLGPELELAGAGLSSITAAMENLDSEQVSHFEDIAKAVKKLENVSFNFNTSGPADVNVTPTDAGVGATATNVVSMPVSQQSQVTNVRRTQFAATGGGSRGNHSALHYPSLQ